MAASQYAPMLDETSVDQFMDTSSVYGTYRQDSYCPIFVLEHYWTLINNDEPGFLATDAVLSEVDGGLREQRKVKRSKAKA